MILCGYRAELRSWSEPKVNNASLILHENSGLPDSIGCGDAGCIEWGTGRGKPSDDMHSSIDIRDQRGLVIGPARALGFDTSEKNRSEASRAKITEEVVECRPPAPAP